MSVLQELNITQINEVIGAAAERCVPVVITAGTGSGLGNLHSRILAIRDEHILLEFPSAGDGGVPHEFVPAERIGVSFKFKHHKHIFGGILVGQERFQLEDGTDVPVLSVVLPVRMQRLQRRAFIRADVPSGRIVRGSFWLGGCDCEPTGTTPDCPVWSGQVLNLSAGGFLLSTPVQISDGLETGDTVGVRIVFGTEGESVFADAQFRHMSIEGDRANLGFQFVGLTETPEGRVVLQMLSAKVSEFTRATQKAGSFKNN